MILEDFHEITRVFLVAGPTNVPNNVLRSMAAPMINHGALPFRKFWKPLPKNRKRFSKPNMRYSPLTASGTGGLEAAVVNFINPGEKVIVASIGNFGERFEKIAKQYDADVEFIDFGWGNAINPEVLEERLAKDVNHEIKAILCQHNETSTAVVNPHQSRFRSKKKATPALLIVDTVSGLGAAEFDMDGWNWTLPLPAPKKPLWLRRDWHSLPPMNEP